MHQSFPRPAIVVLVAVLACAAGCPESGAPRAKRPSAASSAARQGLAQQTALFDSIVDKLRTLPESSLMELAPPTVVLDARSSADGEDMMALLLPQPESPDGPFNRIVVPAGNARFRGGAKAGDIVKYYVKPDRATMDRFNETGEVDIATYDAIDLIVAQVLADNVLLIEGGLPQPITQPSKVEVWRISDDRMNEVDRSLGEYLTRRTPALGWEPSPDGPALQQLTERLNQWLRQTRLAGADADPAGWRRPKLLDTLPEALRKNDALAPALSDADLGAGYFAPHEARLVQGAQWRRDVARWARAGATAPADVAQKLFDWVVRNVQLVEPDAAPPRQAWEALLYGRGDARGRAEVFAGLCAQQNLTAGVVVVPATDADGAPRTWVGVVDGDRLLLFDPELGTPIPAADGSGVASLAEVRADDSLLRRLDLPDLPYPVDAQSAAGAAVYVVATPLELTRRARALQDKLPAESAIVLAVDADATAERLEKLDGVGEVRLWPAPYETIAAKFAVKPSQRRQAVREFLPFAWRPQLWRARTQHLRGQKQRVEGDGAPPSPDDVDDHQLARRLYMNRGVRPTDARLAGVPAEKRDVYRLAKTQATIFLAQLCYDTGAHELAQRWLEEPALEDPSAEPYLPGVRYDLGRALEELGMRKRAAEAYRSVEGPMRPGALLRARSLYDSASKPAAPPEAKEKAAASPAPQPDAAAAGE